MLSHILSHPPKPSPPPLAIHRRVRPLQEHKERLVHGMRNFWRVGGAGDCCMRMCKGGRRQQAETSTVKALQKHKLCLCLMINNSICLYNLNMFKMPMLLRWASPYCIALQRVRTPLAVFTVHATARTCAHDVLPCHMHPLRPRTLRQWRSLRLSCPATNCVLILHGLLAKIYIKKNNCIRCLKCKARMCVHECACVCVADFI